MLNVNGEQEVPLHESIRMDHCYTNLSGPSVSNVQSVLASGTVQPAQPQEQQLQTETQPPFQQSQPVVATVVRGKVTFYIYM